MLLTPPPLVNADTTSTSPSGVSPVKSTCPPADEQFALVLEEPERDVVVAVVLVLLQTEVHDLVAVRGLVTAAAYAFMMSILLLTLLSWLHCQPGMSRVSLLPVANVVASSVQKIVPWSCSSATGAVLRCLGREVTLKVAAVKCPCHSGLDERRVATGRGEDVRPSRTGAAPDRSGCSGPRSMCRRPAGTPGRGPPSAVPAASNSPVITATTAIAASGRRPRRFGVSLDSTRWRPPLT